MVWRDSELAMVTIGSTMFVGRDREKLTLVGILIRGNSPVRSIKKYMQFDNFILTRTEMWGFGSKTQKNSNLAARYALHLQCLGSK